MEQAAFLAHARMPLLSPCKFLMPLLAASDLPSGSSSKESSPNRMNESPEHAPAKLQHDEPAGTACFDENSSLYRSVSHASAAHFLQRGSYVTFLPLALALEQRSLSVIIAVQTPPTADLPLEDLSRIMPSSSLLLSPTGTCANMSFVLIHLTRCSYPSTRRRWRL